MTVHSPGAAVTLDDSIIVLGNPNIIKMSPKLMLIPYEMFREKLESKDLIKSRGIQVQNPILLLP